MTGTPQGEGPHAEDAGQEIPADRLLGEYLAGYAADHDGQTPLSKMSAETVDRIMAYFSEERAIRFDGRHVVNAIVPPVPSRAFDRFLGFFGAWPAREAGLCSVSLAVTNRCPYHCRRCYNARRSQTDLPLETLQSVIAGLLDRGASTVALTGGEPLLREDLEEICRAFDDRACLTLNTTGKGLDPPRARSLKESGLFAISISLDSDDEDEHNRVRGDKNAFQTALGALAAAREAGLYPYAMTVVTPELADGGRLASLGELARKAGALEIRLLEPMRVGGATHEGKMRLVGGDRREVIDHQQGALSQTDGPRFSSLAYHTRPEAFGCFAGRGHLYIDGSGELCPCNYIPLSFGNVARRPLGELLDSISECFAEPRRICAARILAHYIQPDILQTDPAVSRELCRAYLHHGRRFPGDSPSLAEGEYKPVSPKSAPSPAGEQRGDN